METVQGLINYLNTIEDKQQPIIYQFYLAEHLHTDQETFGLVSKELDGLLPDEETSQIVWDMVKQKRGR